MAIIVLLALKIYTGQSKMERKSLDIKLITQHTIAGSNKEKYFEQW